MPDPATTRRVGSGYRRRRPLPAVVLMVTLGLVATVVWIRTLDSAHDRADQTCGAPQPVSVTAPTTDPAAPPPADQPAPQAPPTPGDVLAAGALDDVDPLPPDAVKVRVLNASGKRGQATLVAGVLAEDLGFASAGDPADDPLYADGSMDCHGQIRFGEAGTAAGRTLSIVMPCLELVRDGRQDDTVDLAVGQQFDNLSTSQEAQEVLRQLKELATQPIDPSGGQQGAPVTVDPTLLTAARAVARC
jgi:hypothetical protein